MGIEPLLALIAAVFGGVGLKVIESILNRSKDKYDLGAQMRQELRDDVISLREELDRIDSSLENWRKKYYSLLNAFNELSMVARSAGLEDEVEEIKSRIG